MKPLSYARRVGKLPYYVRALARLARELEHARRLPALVLWPEQAIVTFRHASFRIRDRLDLLLLYETLFEDAYGLSELPANVSCIVDIGAGGGDFAVMAAQRFPGCRVLACEPHPDQVTLLRENLGRNRVATVEVIPVAVGQERSYVLETPGDLARTSARSARGRQEEASVAGRRLDEITRDLDVDLLKVDCEGAELDVLASASNAALGRVARVVVEYHARDGRPLDEPVSARLRECGFMTRTRPNRFDPRIGYVIAWRP